LYIVGALVLPILSFYYKPLRVLVAFFFALLISHLFVAPKIYRFRCGWVGVIFLYTLVVDSFIFCCDPGFSGFLVLPPLFIGLLLTANGFFKYLINYHVKRNIFSKFPSDKFRTAVDAFAVELTNREDYNYFIFLAYCATGLLGYFLEYDNAQILLRFTELSILLITLVSAFLIAIEGNQMASTFNSDFLPVNIEAQDADEGMLRGTLDEMGGIEFEGKELTVDYFDRATEMRKLRYYNSLSLLLICCAYMSVYTLLPNTYLNISLEWVLAGFSIFGIIAIQLPYFVGQKKLAMDLLARYSGTEYREVNSFFGQGSPAWNILNTGEILGVGILPGLGIWVMHFLATKFL